MTRADIESKYQVMNGRCTVHPFINELVYVPHFWHMATKGSRDNDLGGCVRFEVTDEDRAAYPELGAQPTVLLFQDSEGRVWELEDQDDDGV